MEINHKVAITGISLNTSLGNTLSDNVANLKSGKLNRVKKVMSYGDIVIDEVDFHEASKLSLREMFQGDNIKQVYLDEIDFPGMADLHQLIAVGYKAKEDSNVNDVYTNRQIGTVLTHENIGMDESVMLAINKILVGIRNFEGKLQVDGKLAEEICASYEKLFVYNQSFMSLFHFNRMLGIKGSSLFINNACSSGIVALEMGRTLIEAKKVKSVVVVAGDMPGVNKYLYFKRLGFISQDGYMRPYDNLASGFVLGDANVAVVLEDLESAKKRGAKIYGLYCGAGCDMEGYKVSSPNVVSDSYSFAIESCLERCGINASDVDIICTHGSSSRVGDAYEARAISNVFGKHSIQPVTTFKPYLGHTLGATSLVEPVLMLLAMRESFIPPILNIDSNNIQKSVDLNLVYSLIEKPYSNFLKTCNAFCGYNSAALFEEYNG